MGRDKALLPVDGTPMAQRVAGSMRAGGCESVVAIGGDADALAAAGLLTITDRWPGEGPLGGVITALEHFLNADVVVVAACDLPQLSAETVAALIHKLNAAPDETDVAMAITDRRQPLCAAWRPRAAERLSAVFASGGRRLLDALEDLAVLDVIVAAEQLINVNTVDDLPG